MLAWFVFIACAKAARALGETESGRRNAQAAVTKAEGEEKSNRYTSENKK